jgi:hypothetical protein
MDTVALAATIGGSVVALAGVGATAWSGWLQRKSTREIAELQHEHARGLARGERLFEVRAAAYEAMLGFLQVWWERILDTLPVLRFGGAPDPPDAPTPDEWRPMYVRLRTVGSVAVAAGYDDFVKATNDFFIQVELFRSAKEAQEAKLPWQDVEDARTKVKGIYDGIELLVSEELASL